MVGSLTVDCTYAYVTLLLETKGIMNVTDAEASCKLSNQKLTPFPRHETITMTTVKSSLNLPSLLSEAI